MNSSAFSTFGKSGRRHAAWLILTLCALLAFATAPAQGEEKHAAPAGTISHAAEHGGGHHGLPSAAPTFGDRAKGAWVNNSMIATWIVAGLVILFAQIATRRVRSAKDAANHVPNGAENVWEFLVESLHNFLTEIIGPALAKKTFWFFATIFILILAVNWFGLVPGVGTIGWGVPPDPAAPHSLQHVTTPLLRGGMADLNMTAAMALVFFACWVVWALQFNGVVGFFKHLFGAKGGTKGLMLAFLTVIFVIVGLLEVISILFRPVSLSFRLYGNIFAGENLLESMQQVVPALGWLVPIPFYFMELLVGLVQALVFMLLTAVFTLLICSHDEEHEHAHGEAAHH